MLTAALQDEVSSKLNRRKGSRNNGVNRKSPPATPAAAPGGNLSTVSEAAAGSASGRRSFEERDPKGAAAGQGQAEGTVPAASQGCCVIA